LYQYTNKVVCVLGWRLQCTWEPSTLIMKQKKKSNIPTLFQIQTFTLSSQVVPTVKVF